MDLCADTVAGALMGPRRSGPRGRLVAREERERIVDRLLRLRQAGDLSYAAVGHAARAVGVTPRTVYRWLSQGRDRPAPRRATYRLTDTDWRAFEDFRGNIAHVHRARAAAVAGQTTVCGIPIAEHLLTGWHGAPPVARRTLYVAFHREASPAERAYWKHGMKARRDLRVYRTRTGTHRNAIWQTDHTQLHIVVAPPRGKPLRPWLTTFVDHATRVVMGWAIGTSRDSGSVLSALRSALLCDPTQGGAGGIPAVIECDHGAEFTAAAIRRPCDTLGILIRPVETYEGRGKGVIERWHRTIADMLLCQLPGYTDGPRDKQGHLYGPVRDDAAWRASLPDPSTASLDHTNPNSTETASTGPGNAGIGIAGSGNAPSGVETSTPAALPLHAFTTVFAQWVLWFNTEHEHQGLDGQSPLQAWRADPTPIHHVPAEHLRDLLLTQQGATITSRGIRHNNLHYVATELQDRRGEKVTIRYAPHDDRSIEVYHDTTGRHLATAYPVDALSPAQSEDYRQDWTRASRELAARRRSANRRIRRRIDPLTHQHPPSAGTTPATSTPHAGSAVATTAAVPPGAGENDSRSTPDCATAPATPPAETRLIPTAAPRPAGSTRRGSTSLLGLRDTYVLTEFDPLPATDNPPHDATAHDTADQTSGAADGRPGDTMPRSGQP